MSTTDFIVRINGKDVKDKAAARMASIAPVEVSTTAANAYAVGQYFWLNDILYAATTAIAAGEAITVGSNCAAAIIGDDMAGKLDANQGSANAGRLMAVNSSGGVVPAAASGFDVEVTETNLGDDDYSIEFNNYDAGGVVEVSGTTPEIIGVANMRYVCGEVSTISITPPETGTIDVIFTSGSSLAVLTLPNTVMMPDWWTGVEANRVYELLITDGTFGSVMSWATAAVI